MTHHPPPGAQHPRPRRQLDWELITCGVHGHALMGRDAEAIRDQDALLVRDGDGVRWHGCLRCDCWVAVEAVGLWMGKRWAEYLTVIATPQTSAVTERAGILT